MKIITITIAIVLVTGVSTAQETGDSTIKEKAPSSSLLANTPVGVDEAESGQESNALRSESLFAVEAPKPREFQEHDLVQIVVREISRAKSSQELDTKKDFELDGDFPRWPNMSLNDFFELEFQGRRASVNPKFELDFTKDFQGEGDYERKDDFSARLTAEVIEVQPNGNLVLEARTYIKTDEEESTIKVTGICRPEDVTPANTILSNQIHDLVVEKIHTGELKKAGEKGIISKVLEAVFAF